MKSVIIKTISVIAILLGVLFMPIPNYVWEFVYNNLRMIKLILTVAGGITILTMVIILIITDKKEL